MAWTNALDEAGVAPMTAAAAVQRANRRRLLVFLGVFVVTATIGLIWDFTRPPEYRATARLQITPAATSAPTEELATVGTEPSAPFFAEVQALSSRPLIETVAARMHGIGIDLSALGRDPILGLQSALTVKALEGTNVVELAAVGDSPELPATLLAGITEAYREAIARAFKDSASESSARADEETSRLEAAVAAKRRAVEDFRIRSGIVSPEREENQVAAEVQGLATALKDANKQIATAEGKVAALRESAAGGRGVARARDDPTLANLEQRASQAREALRDMARNFTPDYMAMDPNAKALRARLAELDEQIKTQREVGQDASLVAAQEELAGAREAARRLQEQLAAGKQQVGQFTARFAQYKSLQEELAQLEKTYQAAQQRQARLQATERSRMPSLQVIEQAALPRQPWRPHYWRDAGIVSAVALLLALGTMWLVELFNREPLAPSVVVAQPVLAGTLLPGNATLGYGELARPQLAVNDPPLLAAPPALPRELTAEEITALLRSADRDTRLAVTLLLAGIAPEELVALRWRDIDAGSARIPGAQPRGVQPASAVARLLSEAAGDADATVLRGPTGSNATAESLASQLLCAAHDAGLERVHEITPQAVRHTYIAFLVRQGAKFADLTRWVGALNGEQLAAYSALAPPGSRIAGDAVQRDYPALTEIEPARG